MRDPILKTTLVHFRELTIGLAFAFVVFLKAGTSNAVPVHSSFIDAWTGQAFKDSLALVAPGIVKPSLENGHRHLDTSRRFPSRIDTQIQRAAQDSLRDAIRRSRKTRLHRHIMADMRQRNPRVVQRQSDARSVASPTSNVPGDRRNNPSLANASATPESYRARSSRLARNNVRHVGATTPNSTTAPGSMGTQLVDPLVDRTDRPSHRRRHRHLNEPPASSEAANSNVSVIDQNSNHPADRPGTPPALDTPSGADIPTRPPARRPLR